MSVTQTGSIALLAFVFGDYAANYQTTIKQNVDESIGEK
jgi:hypothetical protein